MPPWGPPLIGAGSTIILLNVALAIQRFRERYGGWAIRLVFELRRWDGRLPDDFDTHASS